MMKNNDANNLTYSLKQSLKEWTDIDVAAFHAGVALGIIPPLSDEKDIYDFGGQKWMFWTENPLGTLLFDLINSLAENNVLERHEKDDQLLRRNPNFNWENL